MKLLFITTFNVTIEHDHIFTINVWKHLALAIDNCCICSILLDKTITEPDIIESMSNGKKYYKLIIPEKYTEKDRIQHYTNHILKLYQKVQPSIVHTNMIEGYEVMAARRYGIPIVLTIHIGGIICPRGGGNGFLKYDDKICDRPVSEKCLKCCCNDLPILQSIAYIIFKHIPENILLNLNNHLQGKHIFYLSAILEYISNINRRKRLIKIFQYATIIAADKKLVELLAINGLYNNVKLIPHGIPIITHRPIQIKENEPIKFFTLGRIQYSKGIHVIFKALKGININSYELHIIGNIMSDSRMERLYTKLILRKAKNLNVIFHKNVPHDKIGEVISQCHVMIHGAIFLEVYGIAIAESLSIGRPVLSTRCGGAEMQITDNLNGWLVAPNNPDEMKEKILFLINNRSRIVEASNHCNVPNNIDNYIKELTQLYSQELKKKTEFK